MKLRLLLVISAFLVASGCKGKAKSEGGAGSDERLTAPSPDEPSDQFPDKIRRTMNPANAVRSMSGAADAAYKHYQDGAGKNFGAMAPAPQRLLKRARFLGTVGDYDKALAVATYLVEKQGPLKGPNLLRRAQVYAALHRWDDARKDLEGAMKYQVAQRAIDDQLATIDLAEGKFERALAFRRDWVERKLSYPNLGALGVVLAEMGQLDKADRRFNQAINSWNKSYPFDLAWLLFEKGRIREARDQKAEARKLYEMAHERFPQYAHLTGHLAALMAEKGELDGAIAKLRPIVEQADDPQYKGQLGEYLIKSGNKDEGEKLLAEARTEYDELMQKHPAAFADHAARFWMAGGGDAKKALELAQLNVENRKTSESFALLLDAAKAAEVDAAEACTLADQAVSKIETPSAYLRFAASRSFRDCGQDAKADKLTAK